MMLKEIYIHEGGSNLLPISFSIKEEFLTFNEPMQN